MTTDTTRGLDIASAESNWGFRGINYVFAIGIDRYAYWPPLKCAVKDVQDFTGVLTARYQFDKKEVTMLTNTEATEKNILAGLRSLVQRVTDQDNVIIYFSGHGHYDELTKTGYWIPVDAPLATENEDQFINTAIIVDRLKAINSLHTFLIIDACFSGTLLTQIRSTPRSERYKSRRVFTSGRAEVVRDGPEGGNSPFARGLLYNLMQNTEKYLPASRLIVDVCEYVEKEAQQTPMDARLINADDQGGDFVFHLRPTAKDLTAALPTGEDEAWETARKTGSYMAYLDFIQAYPQSGFAGEAQGEMKRLDNIALNQIRLGEHNRNLSLEEKISQCIAYFNTHPGAANNGLVNQIKNLLEIQKYNQRK